MWANVVFILEYSAFVYSLEINVCILKNGIWWFVACRCSSCDSATMAVSTVLYRSDIVPSIVPDQFKPTPYLTFEW